MKRFFALAALLLGLAACQTEPEGLDVNVGGAVDTTITVAIPEGTRASSDQGFDLSTLGTNYSLRYILEIYRVENGNVLYNNCQRFVETSNNSQPMVFPVRLAQDYDYQIVAWADIVVKDSKDDRYYYTQAGLDEIAILDNGTVNWNAMDETRDAYTYAKRITKFNSASDLNMPLTRPFAKLRVVATDIDDIRAVGLEPTTATVTYSQDMFFKYNAVADVENKGTAYHTAEKTHEFTYSTTATKYDVQTGEFTLFSDYIFVPSTGTAKFTLKVYADEAQSKLIKENNFSTEIFVQRNKLTTIKGDVLTVGGNVEVKVENGWGELETYTYVSSGADLIKAINSNGKSILGNNITVNEDDIALAGRLAATRSTDSKSVINLNGFTITVNNKKENGVALITLANNHTLVFAGKGDIVMTSESTAPFVNTNTNNAIVIIEQATVESQNQNAAVVDGNAIVNAAATVGEGAVSGEVKPQLEYVLANGGEVTLFEDVTSDKILEISATNPVVINGNGKTITFTANRGFRITASNNVTIENATIVNDVNGGRCIETRTGNINLTLNNINLTATQTGSQPFTVGGTGIDVTVNINNSTINAGKGYGITTFNPTALTINNSTVTGYAALNIKAASGSEGSAGSVINVTGSTLAGVNNWSGESNAFSTIMLEDSDVTINIDSTSTVKVIATSNNQSALCFGNELVKSIVSGCDITIAGNIVMDGDDARLVDYSETQGGIGGNIVKFAAEYADELEAEGWIVGEPTDGLVTIPSAIAKVGDNLYKTLAEAVAAVEDGGTIILVENEVFTKNNRYNNGGWWDGLGYIGDKSFTIDLKNHSISQDGSLNDYLIWIKNNGTKANTITLKNGTLDAGKTAYCALATASSNAQKITINLENIELINDNTNGAVVKLRAGAELNIKDGTKIIGKNSYTGIECVASTTNIYEGAEIYQNGTSSSWGFLAGASWGGIINVYGGKGTSARGGFMAMTSGGTINVSGGEWTANVDGTIGNNSNLYVLTAQNNKYESGYKGASIINVTGGTFRGGMDAWILNDVNTEKAELNISGGNFNANPSEYVVEGYTAVEGENGNWTVESKGYYTDANGNYHITGVKGWLWMADQSDTFFGSKTVYLDNDIDFKDVDMRVTRMWTDEYTATFDGQGHTVSNIWMASNYTSNNQALFDGLMNVKNLNVYNAEVYGMSAVGIIGANIFGTIENCHVSKSRAYGYVWQVGGIVGLHSWGEIKNCSVEDTRVECYYYGAVGAIAGAMNEMSRNITNCSVKNCKLIKEGTAPEYADYDGLFGAMVGYIDTNGTYAFTGEIESCSTTMNGSTTDSAVYGEAPSGAIITFNGVQL